MLIVETEWLRDGLELVASATILNLVPAPGSRHLRAVGLLRFLAILTEMAVSHCNKTLTSDVVSDYSHAHVHPAHDK
jgi:hypothetical protein